MFLSREGPPKKAVKESSFYRKPVKHRRSKDPSKDLFRLFLSSFGIWFSVSDDILTVIYGRLFEDPLGEQDPSSFFYGNKILQSFFFSRRTLKGQLSLHRQPFPSFIIIISFRGLLLVKRIFSVQKPFSSPSALEFPKSLRCRFTESLGGSSHASYWQKTLWIFSTCERPHEGLYL